MDAPGCGDRPVFPQVVGCAMRDRADTEWVVQALLSAVWRRKPASGYLVHSDQGSVYASDDWQNFLASPWFGVQHEPARQLPRARSLPFGHNAPVQSFFGLLKRKRIRRRIDPAKDAARAECSITSRCSTTHKRRHGSTGDLSPVAFERRCAQRGS
uniref:DDE-type integrase/transposase/recombinase n=1 Tax=Xanthomonas axonopodis TaxID=53413 RepID=UPI003D7856E2